VQQRDRDRACLVALFAVVAIFFVIAVVAVVTA
jgi:hypothetical protein